MTQLATTRGLSLSIPQTRLKILAVIGGTMATALAAQVAIPLPPFGIPLTLQTLAVCLTAVALGPRLGMASMALYMVLGAIGLPVFAESSGGFTYLYGQTGGYLLGFILAQPLINLIARANIQRRWLAVAGAVLAGHALIFALGVPWLFISRTLFLENPITLSAAMYFGCIVFLPGMVIKAAIASILGPKLVASSKARGW